MSTYPFTKTPVNLTQITAEVNVGLPAPSNPILYINYDDPNGVITFTSALSGGQTTYLTNYFTTYTILDNPSVELDTISSVFGTTATLQINQTANRTITFPDTSDTIVTQAFVQPITNKTINGSLNTISNISLTSAVTGTLPVANGGTGAATLTSGNFVIGAGTGAVTTTKVAPSGVVVGTTDTQTLTNKTVDASANTLSNIDLSSATVVINSLPVNRGGTGVATLTSGNFVIGAGTSAVTTTKVAPAGTVVGTTDTQTLTNKTIDGASNTITNVSLTTGVTGTLPVANGGTGATTLTNNTFLTGTGTTAVATTKVVPTGVVLGTTDTQTLTNKTITGTTNTVAAKQLLSATTSIDVSAATAPSAGQVLTATNSTTATWQTPSATPTEYVYAESLTLSSTTSTTYSTKVTLSIANALGTYLIMYSWTWNYGSTAGGNSFLGRIMQNGATNLAQLQAIPTNTSAAQRYPFAGIAQIVVGTQATQTITLEFATLKNGITSNIYNGRLAAFRVA